MVEVMRPGPEHDDLRPGLRHRRLPARRPRLHRRTTTSSTATRSASCATRRLRGIEIVDGIARLCAMNLSCTASAARQSPVVGATTASRSTRRDALRHGADQPALRQEELLYRARRRRQGRQREPDLRARRLLGHHLQQAAQLPPARQDAPEDRRHGGGRRARQRALRGRRRRDGAAQAAARVRRPHPAAAADRHLLRPGRQGQRAVLRPQAGQRDAVDEEALDLRPPHQPALHAQAEHR